MSSRKFVVTAQVANRASLGVAAFVMFPVSRRSDRFLIQAVRRGSTTALDELISRYWHDVSRTALAIVRDHQGAEDVAQETMILVARHLDRFDVRRPFGPWLHRITVRCALNWLRRQKRQPTSASDPEVLVATPVSAEPDDGLDPELLAALGRLDPQDRSIVVLRHVLGFRSNEIGRILDLSAATVRTRLARAFRDVRAALGEEPGR
jgi:RNA polymerase sigma-70 factor (ECF subfamily)